MPRETIFSGTVTAVNHRPANAGQSVETLAVTFPIEQAIGGVITSEDLTIFQWVGLWSDGQRYRQGERVLLFLYAPSKLGLTSCVGGEMGRFRSARQVSRTMLSLAAAPLVSASVMAVEATVAGSVRVMLCTLSLCGGTARMAASALIASVRFRWPARSGRGDYRRD